MRKEERERNRKKKRRLDKFSTKNRKNRKFKFEQTHRKIKKTRRLTNVSGGMGDKDGEKEENLNEDGKEKTLFVTHVPSYNIFTIPRTLATHDSKY